jgi:hypothetical protein
MSDKNNPEETEELPINLDEWEPPEVTNAGQVLNEHGGVVHQVSGTVGVGSGTVMAEPIEQEEQG